MCEILIKAYGESPMSKTRVYEWYKRFQDGREDVEDDERPGRPSLHIRQTWLHVTFSYFQI